VSEEGKAKETNALNTICINEDESNPQKNYTFLIASIKMYKNG